MIAAYSDQAVLRLRRALGRVWDETVSAARRSRAAGIIKGQPADDFDLLDVLNFHVVLDAEFDVLFPPEAGETKEARNERKSAIVAWARIVRSARNPISHPIEGEVSASDAMGCIAAARMVTSFIDPVVEKELAAIMEGLATARPRTVTGGLAIGYTVLLPPAETICPQFVGREEQLSALRAWFDDDDLRRRLLAGSGGKGKTAIAYEFARRVRDSEQARVQAIIWLSAKRRAFIDGEVQELPHTDFRSLDEATGRILHTLRKTEAETLETTDRRAAALRAMDETAALVVVDDVDTLDGKDEAVHEFFLEASFTTRGKFLFTSRRPIHGLGGATTVVPGLSQEEGLAMIAARAELYGLPTLSLTPDRCQRILETTDRTPLYVDELMRLIASGVPVDQATKAWREHGGENAREYALRREVEQLSREARRTLIAASLPEQGASMAELSVVTGLPQSEVGPAIGELVSLFLMPRKQEAAGNEAFQLEGNTKALVRAMAEREFPDDLRQLIGARKAIVGGLPGRRGRVGEYVTRAAFLAKAKRWDEAERAIEAGLSAFPEHPELLAELGGLYRSMKPPRVSDARAAFKRAHELGSTNPQMHRRWMRLEIETKQWTVAVAAADASLTSCPNDRPIQYLAAWGHWHRGRELASEGLTSGAEEFAGARQLLREALEQRPAMTAPSGFNDAALLSALCGVLQDEIKFAERVGRNAVALRSEAQGYLSKWRASYPGDTRLGRFADLASEGRLRPDPPKPTASTSSPERDRASLEPIAVLDSGQIALPEYRIGQIVFHRSFGRGKVVSASSGQPSLRSYDIDFDRVGRRRVTVSSGLLRLEPVRTPGSARNRARGGGRPEQRR